MIAGFWTPGKSLEGLRHGRSLRPGAVRLRASGMWAQTLDETRSMRYNAEKRRGQPLGRSADN